MSKLQVLELLQIKNTIRGTPMLVNEKRFQSLVNVNGIFQAEGNWGGYFTSINSVNFRPLWFISQIASIESIQFFSLLNQVFNYQLAFQLQV